MFDLKWIRENPETLDRSLERRGAEAASAAILKLDGERRSVQTRLQEMQNRRNAASKEIGKAMGEGRANEAEALKQQGECPCTKVQLKKRSATTGRR